jgi:hypothetical protein
MQRDTSRDDHDQPKEHLRQSIVVARARTKGEQKRSVEFRLGMTQEKISEKHGLCNDLSYTGSGQKVAIAVVMRGEMCRNGVVGNAHRPISLFRLRCACPAKWATPRRPSPCGNPFASRSCDGAPNSREPHPASRPTAQRPAQVDDPKRPPGTNVAPARHVGRCTAADTRASGLTQPPCSGSLAYVLHLLHQP